MNVQVRKRQNVAVLTCAKENCSRSCLTQTRRGSQVLKPWYGCVLAEEACVSDVYSGGILHWKHDTKPIQDNLTRFCTEIFHENFFRALDNLTGFQSMHILP